MNWLAFYLNNFTEVFLQLYRIKAAKCNTSLQKNEMRYGYNFYGSTSNSFEV